MREKIYYKTNEEIELIRESSLLVGKTLGEIAKWIYPGIKTKKLDQIAEEYIRSYNAKPGFRGYNNFPNTLCISINEQIVHGIPSERELKDGDIVSVDCGVLMNGYYGDSAYTYEVGEVSKEKKQLLKITKESLNKAIDVAFEGNRIGDIGFTIQHYVTEYGYSIVRELVGHGVGKNLHEKPQIPNYGKKGRGIVLQEGLVIAIEPMVNLGKKEIRTEKDGWTVVTKDGLASAHFEHTVAIKKNKADILSSFKYVEEVLKNKIT